MWKWEWICWLVKLISWNPSQRVRRFRRLIERLSKEADLEGGWWTTFREYSKQAVASSIALSKNEPDNRSDTAIVVQGPVIEQDNLTLETLKLYRKTMPNSVLILSTWNDIAPQTRRLAEAQGVTVVTSEIPENSGPHNLNLQITSTHRGLVEAKRLGCQYAMKTRADTRILMADADWFCRDLLRQFPVTEKVDQKERLVVVDFATRLYIPFHPSDILMFGQTDDLLNYWSLELCSPEMAFRVCDEFDELLRQSIPEVVLCRSFLQRTGESIQDDIAQWWEVLSRRFVVIDRDMIDWFWPKYDYNVNHRLESQLDTGNMALCHFAQWLQLVTRPTTPRVKLKELRKHRVNQPLQVDTDEAAAVIGRIQ